jgi:hypothetical protein
MRHWEIQDGETARSYAAFGVYRDLGAGRTLREAATLFYGGQEGATDAQYDQFKLWSRTHDWQERARHYDRWLEMEKRSFLESHLRDKAEDHAQREVELREKALQIREAMAEQASHMLRFPLTEQRRRVEDGPDGEEVVYHFHPAGWTKATAVSFFNAVVGNAEDPEPVDLQRFDYSVLSYEELLHLNEMFGKLEDAPRLSPEKPER